MPTLQFSRKGIARLSSGHMAGVRVIDVELNLARDVTMGTATDDIVVADIPAGAIVIAASIEQIVVGTGTGTLVARAGSTTMSATLASTAAAGTIAAGAAINPVVATGATTINVLGATATRLDGVIRVFAVVVEGVRPARSVAAARDTTL